MNSVFVGNSHCLKMILALVFVINLLDGNHPMKLNEDIETECSESEDPEATVFDEEYSDPSHPHDYYQCQEKNHVVEVKMTMCFQSRMFERSYICTISV